MSERAQKIIELCVDRYGLFDECASAANVAVYRSELEAEIDAILVGVNATFRCSECKREIVGVQIFSQQEGACLACGYIKPDAPS